MRQTRRYNHPRPLANLDRPRKPWSAPDGIRRTLPGTFAFASKFASKKVRKGRTQLRLDIKGEREAESLARALATGTYQDVIREYRGMEDKKKLHPRDLTTITQRLHQALREAKWAQGRDEPNDATPEIVEFAEELVGDIKNGTLSPSRRAHLRLLGIFKESGARDAGVTFWSWLEGQDEAFVDADVYGAAIELLATHGTPLAELEELYRKALGRFPGTFALYHLAPNAILENRDQVTTLHGMPMTLLQGILTARLLNGDTRNAYLALDTALRLYPDQTPARFFTLFSEERPVVESYTVFAMAWRAGISLPQGHFRYQLSALRSNTDFVSVKRHPWAIRTMLSALYMHSGARGAIAQNSINELIIGMTQFLRLEAVSAMEPKDKQRVVLAVMEIIRKIIAVFVRFGAKPGLSAFNSIIVNVGGYGHSKQTIGIALADARTLGMEPNEVTRRSIIIAAGLLDDVELMKKGWAQIVEARTVTEETPDVTDFHCLVKAAHLTNEVDFAREEFESYKDGMSSEEREPISDGLNDSNMYNLGIMQASEEVPVSTILDEIKKISADLDFIGERTEKAGKLQDYRDQALPMKLLVEDEILLPEADMRRIYDELTTEERAPQDAIEEATVNLGEQVQSEPSTPALTPTNIPFGTIRYENWKLINFLLEQSEANDKAYRDAVDKAIAAGTVPPHRSKGLAPNIAFREIESFGLSDLVEMGKKTKKDRPAKQDEIRMAKENILRLRGRPS